MLLDFILNGFLLSITNVFRFVVGVYCFFLLFGKVVFLLLLLVTNLVPFLTCIKIVAQFTTFELFNCIVFDLEIVISFVNKIMSAFSYC